MAETWITPRKCHSCFLEKKVEYLWAQKWYQNENGSWVYRVTCHHCGYAEETTWEGRR